MKKKNVGGREKKSEGRVAKGNKKFMRRAR